MHRTVPALAVATAVLAGCSGLTQRVADRVRYELESVEVELRGPSMPLLGLPLPPTGVGVAVVVRFVNNNGFDLRVEEVDYQVLVGGIPAARGATREPFDLPSRLPVSLPLPLQPDLSSTPALLADLVLGSTTQIEVRGTVVASSRYGHHSLQFELRQDRIEVHE